MFRRPVSLDSGNGVFRRGSSGPTVDPVRRRVVLSTLAAWALAACGKGDEPQTFPSLALARLDGGMIGLDSLRDRPLLVNLWATWCPPCRREMGSLERMSRRVGDAIRVVGISVDEDLNLAREFVRKEGVSFINLADPGMRALRGPLAVTALPETLLIMPDGRIALRMRGAREWDDEALIAELLHAAGAA